MIIGSIGTSVALAVVAVAIFALIVVFLKSCLKVVQQGCVGVVKRFGEFKAIKQPGLHVLLPLADRMDKVDVREFPRTGDQQAVITKDNVSLWVSATIFCQVIDVKSALFEINDYQLAVDQLSRTALRAVIGEMSLDQAPRGQGLGATAPAPFCFSGESFESDDPDLRVLRRTSADPIRLAAS